MMRVLIEGDDATAKALRGYLARHDFHLTSHAPDFAVRIEEQAGAVRPLICAFLVSSSRLFYGIFANRQLRLSRFPPAAGSPAGLYGLSCRRRKMSGGRQR
jgi:hypothetical protein